MPLQPGTRVGNYEVLSELGFRVARGAGRFLARERCVEMPDPVGNRVAAQAVTDYLIDERIGLMLP